MEDRYSNTEADAGAFDRAMLGPTRRARSPYAGEDEPDLADLAAEEAEKRKPTWRR